MELNSHVDSYLQECIEIINKIDRRQIIAVSTILKKIQMHNGRVFVLGVGGSAANASHFVNDLRKICGIEAYAPSDNVSELTARINDDGWETVFENWLKGSHLSSKDGIFILSVGGGNEEKNISANLVRAMRYAKKIGVDIMGIVGRNGGFTKQVADACVVIPVVNNETITPHTEAFQAVIWHLLVSCPDLKKYEMKWERTK